MPFRVLVRSVTALLLAAAVAFAVGARETLLRELASALRGTGVGVRTSWSEKVKAKAPVAPTLAPLRGFPLSKEKGLKTRRFEELFKAGAFEDAALIAVSGKGRPKASVARELPRLWKRAPPSKRVFIAFARGDLRAANAIRRALEGKGYLCFTYIHGRSSNVPWANAVEVGRYFREAGVHLVIDSRAARASKGVRLEAHALPQLRSAPVAKTKKTTTSAAPSTSKRNGQPCCKVCYYLNGMLVGCDPVTCGAHCANARGS
jgi:hypothetical protein